MFSGAMMERPQESPLIYSALSTHSIKPCSTSPLAVSDLRSEELGVDVCKSQTRHGPGLPKVFNPSAQNVAKSQGTHKPY